MKIKRKNASRIRSSYLYVIDVQARANTPFLYVVVLTGECEAMVNFLGIVR
jgi:hypothetical protein